MKNKFIVATFLGAFLLISPNVKAANFTDNQIVDANKMWTIKFTSDVGFDDSTKQGITVTDIKGNLVDISLNQGNDTKTVLVNAPQGGYTPGESYMLNVGKKTHSNRGKSLKKEYNLHFSVKSNSNIVSFKDKNLEKVVRDMINKPTGDIYKSDVEKITDLNADNKNIQSISGIGSLINLKNVNLQNNQIIDISALKELTNLKSIVLEFNKISDISALKELTNLEEVYLYKNQISDISALKGLTNLKKVGLESNQISDINVLKGLTNLEELALGDNQISNINELKGLNNLKLIFLGYNQISDISALKELTNLKNIDLESNEISDMSVLKGLTNLQNLYLGNNQISDADKQALKNALPKCNISYQ